MNYNMKPKQLCGQLYKYTNVMKGWQYRYFLLDAQAGTLHYYLCEGDKPENNTPRGSVHLAAAVICPSDEDSKTFTVNCANGDMLKLRASDARARQEWVNGLRAIAESHTKVSLRFNMIFCVSKLSRKDIAITAELLKHFKY